MLPALAPIDELRAIAWQRSHGTSEELILAPHENAPWMATIQVPRPGSETHPALIDIDRKSKFQLIPAPGQGQVIIMIMERIPSGVWRDGRAGSRENRVRQAQLISFRDQLAQFLESVRLTGAVPGTVIINGQDLEIASYLYTWI